MEANNLSTGAIPKKKKRRGKRKQQSTTTERAWNETMMTEMRNAQSIRSLQVATTSHALGQAAAAPLTHVQKQVEQLALAVAEAETKVTQTMAQVASALSKTQDKKKKVVGSKREQTLFVVQPQASSGTDKKTSAAKKLRQHEENPSLSKAQSETGLKLAQAAALKRAAVYKFTNFLTPLELKVLEPFNVVLSGLLRINHKSHQEGYVTVPGVDSDILIRGIKDRNRALHGDEVHVLLRPNTQERKSKGEVLLSGVVVAIKKYNHNRLCIGTLDPFYKSSKRFGVLTPTDMRLPRLRINEALLPPGYKEHPIDFQDMLFASRIICWNNINLADGGQLFALGTAGSADSETQAILLRHNLDVSPYPVQFNRYFPPFPFKIPAEEYATRTVGKGTCVFTIDPATAKDLDDAVSCDKLANGNYLVGVHIADVTYFLKEGTELDKAVAERATTVYLVNKVFHMLPRDLCAICSLTPSEDKLTFSVFWEFTPGGEILNRRFEKTITNSCAQLSYEQVQGIIDGTNPVLPPIENGHTEDTVINTIHILHGLAEKLRAGRVENGALRIDQTKISFILDPETGLPVDYVTEVQLAAHRLIEEFMLLANCSVAEMIQERHPDLALLRSHPPPQWGMLKRLQTRLEAYGMSLDISNSKSLQSSIASIRDDFGYVGQTMVLFNALTKPMMRAKYFCSKFCELEEERAHFALSIPLYTHFTSPIRRYADIVVHRILASALKIYDKPSMSSEEIESVASNCNVKKYNAKLAQDSSTELFFGLYVASREPMILEAVVTNVCGNSIDCILETGIHVSIFYDKIKGKVKRVEQNKIFQAHIEWSDGRQQIIEMFSFVTIELTRGKGVLLNATLLPPPLLSTQVFSPSSSPFSSPLTYAQIPGLESPDKRSSSSNISTSLINLTEPQASGSSASSTTFPEFPIFAPPALGSSASSTTFPEFPTIAPPASGSSASSTTFPEFPTFAPPASDSLSISLQREASPSSDPLDLLGLSATELPDSVISSLLSVFDSSLVITPSESVQTVTSLESCLVTSSSSLSCATALPDLTEPSSSPLNLSLPSTSKSAPSL